MKTMDELDAYVLAHKISVAMFFGTDFNYAIGAPTWGITLKKDNSDGIKVEVKTRHASLHVAYDDAVARFDGIANRGAPTLLAPQLEYTTYTDVSVATSDDEIPF